MPFLGACLVFLPVLPAEDQSSLASLSGEGMMKIAVASMDGIRVTRHADFCRRFYVFSREDSGEISRECRVLEVGHSVRDVPLEVENPLADCSALIAASMDHWLANRLGAAGIRCFVAAESLAEQAVSAFFEGRLREFRADFGAENVTHRNEPASP